VPRQALEEGVLGRLDQPAAVRDAKKILNPFLRPDRLGHLDLERGFDVPAQVSVEGEAQPTVLGLLGAKLGRLVCWIDPALIVRLFDGNRST
jgi:hypothetical protein